MNKKRIGIFAGVFALLAATGWWGVTQAEIVSDIHVQSDADVVRLDIDSRTYHEIENFFKEGYPTASVLLHAVSLGMGIDDAVYLAVKADRQKAAEIYATAAGLLPSLPGWVCHSGANGSDRYHQEYSLKDLGPQPTIQEVANRFFNQNERIAPFPNWQHGGFHMMASVAELAKLVKPAYWYKIENTDTSKDVRTGEKRPVFISLYRDTKEIIVDDNLHQIADAQKKGITKLPVVFVYNDHKFNPISKYGKDVTLANVANQFFGNQEELTPVPSWEDGDYHLQVKTNEFDKLFKIPAKKDVDPARWAALEAQIKKDGFANKPVLVSMLQNKRMWVDSPDRIAVAESLGMKQLPTVVFFHSMDRQSCGVAATNCLNRICAAAVAAGADPTVCNAAPAAGGTTTPPTTPPPPPGGGTPSPS